MFITAKISLFSTLIKVGVEASFGRFVELLVIGNECFVFLLLFSSLNMNQLSFIFSLLLIVSVASTTFGSAIKASNPNEQVKENSFMLLPLTKIKIAKTFVVRFTPKMKFEVYGMHEK